MTYSKGTSTNLVAHPPRRPGRQQAGRRGEGGLRPPRRAQLRLGSCLFNTGPAPSPSPGKRLSRGHEINKGRRGVSVGCGGAAPGEVRVYVRRWPQPRPSTHGPPAPAGSRWGQRRRPGGRVLDFCHLPPLLLSAPSLLPKAVPEAKLSIWLGREGRGGRCPGPGPFPGRGPGLAELGQRSREAGAPSRQGL